jgi:hypothetical protein
MSNVSEFSDEMNDNLVDIIYESLLFLLSITFILNLSEQLEYTVDYIFL